MTWEDKSGRINHQGQRLVWRQVADDITAEIEAGTLAAGARLPSEVELSDLYGVSRVTIRRAIQELASAGVLAVVHGRGTFVKES